MLRDHTGRSTPVVRPPSTKTSEVTISSRPPGCTNPHLAGGVWKRCGKARCCRGCHDIFAWRQSLCLSRSFETQPPTHFAAVHPAAVSGRSFAGDLGRALRRVRRRLPGLEYLWAFEWVD